MSDSEPLLDIEQAARFLNVSETSLRRWTNSGRLACLRVGRRRERRFRRTDLLEFLERQPAEGAGGSALQRGAHLCGLYATDSGRINQAVSFLAEGARPGVVSFLVTGGKTGQQILDALVQRHPAWRPHFEAGRLILGEYARSAEAQLRWWEANMLAAIRDGATSLRAVGDVWGIAEGVSPEELLAYEAEYQQRIARKLPVVTLCQYDARRFSSLAVLDALKGHRDNFQCPADLLLA